MTCLPLEAFYVYNPIVVTTGRAEPCHPESCKTAAGFYDSVLNWKYMVIFKPRDRMRAALFWQRYG